MAGLLQSLRYARLLTPVQQRPFVNPAPVLTQEILPRSIARRASTQSFHREDQRLSAGWPVAFLALLAGIHAVDSSSRTASADEEEPADLSLSFEANRGNLLATPFDASEEVECEADGQRWQQLQEQENQKDEEELEQKQDQEEEEGKEEERETEQIELFQWSPFCQEADRRYLETYETEDFVPTMRYWHAELQQAVQAHETNAEMLWRLARTSHYLGRYSHEKSDSVAYAQEAHAYAKQALQHEPESWLAHKWVAVTLYALCEIEGIRSQLNNAQIMKDLLDRAALLNPAGDAMIHHLRGYWTFYFANMPWIQRRIAATIFAEPPQGSYEDALEMFLLAEQTEPAFYPRNKLMIGKAYLAVGDHENAVHWLRRARDSAILNEDDELCRKEAEEELARI